MENKNTRYLIFGMLLIVLALAFFTFWPLLKEENKSAKENDANAYETKASNVNNVEFKVTPLKENEFKVSIDTHSVELDFDLAQIAKLYDDSGKAYVPLRWEGSAPGGHHRSGTLIFSEIDKNSKSMKLVIEDSARREFQWNVR